MEKCKDSLCQSSLDCWQHHIRPICCKSTRLIGFNSPYASTSFSSDVAAIIFLCASLQLTPPSQALHNASVSHEMHFRNLSSDCLRMVLTMLRFEDKESLYATFDVQLQQVIRASMPIIEISDRWQRFEAIYLIRSLANVHHIELGAHAAWTATNLSLLRALNPISLVLSDDLLHPSVYDILLQDDKDMRRSEVRSVVNNLSPNGFPNLGFLTRRLKSLHINTPRSAVLPLLAKQSDAQRSFLEQHGLTYAVPWPSDLMHFEGDFKNAYEPRFINALPDRLISLRLRASDFQMQIGRISNDVVPFDDIFIRFTRLRSLEIDTFYRYSLLKSSTPPKSLMSLTLRNSACFPLALLRAINFEGSQLADITVEPHKDVFTRSVPPELCNLDVHLPPSLLNAIIIVRGGTESRGPPAMLCALPRNLVELKLKLKRPSGDFLNSLAALRSLKKLEFSAGMSSSFIAASSQHGRTLVPLDSSSEPINTIFKSSMLPVTLTDLKFNQRASAQLTKDSVEHLPPNLTKLSVGQFRYEHLEDLSKRCPNCRLHFNKEVTLSSPGRFLLDLIESNFPSLWAPTLNVCAIITSIHAFMAINKIYATFGASRELNCAQVKTIVQTSALLSTSPFARGLSLNTFLNLKTIGSEYPSLETISIAEADGWRLTVMPSSVASLDLGSTPVDVGENLMRPKRSFKRISSTYTLSLVEFEELNFPSPYLRYLDTPNWIYSPTQFKRLNKTPMKLLKCKILVADYNALDYMINELSSYSCSLDGVKVLVVPTGSLIRDNDDSCMKEVTWKAICDETESTLKRFLQRAIVLTAPSEGPGDSDTLRRLADSIEVERSLMFDCHVISIPRSATSAVFDLKAPYYLSANLRTVLPLEEGHWPHFETWLYDEDGDVDEDYLRPRTSAFFGLNLVHLELHGVCNPHHCIKQLPPHLQYLHLRVPDTAFEVEFSKVSSLRSVVIESFGGDNFVIDVLQDLPPSVRHLALKSTRNSSTRSLKPEDRLSLGPRLHKLETLLLHNYSFDVTYDTSQRLEAGALHRFEVYPSEIVHGSPWEWVPTSNAAHIPAALKQVRLVSDFDVSAFKALSDMEYRDDAEMAIATLSADEQHFFDLMPAYADLFEFRTVTTTKRTTLMSRTQFNKIRSQGAPQ